MSHDRDLISLSPPRKEDILFRADTSDAMANACLNYTWSPESFYTEGYRVAARSLANQVLETCRDQDILVFPIVYLYRHHLELILKRLIVLGSSILERKLSEVEIRHLEKHRLDLLWNNFRPVLDAVCKEVGWKTPSQEDVEGVNSYIRQLTEVDPESQSFRYALSKKGVPSVPHLKHINIRVLAEGMERLAYFLEGIEAGLDHLEEAKNEMRAEAYRNADY
jgi:hypothetical protein